MLPVVLVIGVCMGLAVPHVATQSWWLALALPLVVGWGLIVGIADESFGTFAAGTGLAFVNFVVGAALGALAGKAIRSVHGAATHHAS